ncbi:uncharacterized protein [Miscanthus floridulus]|uniref:uncharacterized protein n=1 Tax=Miscanthus floridulus TaxID=154761 RepID=UPI0034576FD0
MDATEIPEGIDPKNACRVEVTVNSYFSIVHGKKVYNRGRDVSWVVDSKKYSVINLEKDIASHFAWDNNQQANFWVVKGMHWTDKLISDGQLHSLLRASQLVKFMMIVGNRVEGDEMPPAVNMDCEGMPNEVPVVEKKTEFEGFEWAEIPQYGETIAGPPMPEEEEKEHFMTVGCDPDGDEPTGVDEEWRYLKPVDAAVNDAQPTENIEVELQKRKRARPVLDFDSECVHDYYSVERFKMAYQFQIAPMNDKSQWPKVNLGFEMIPPPLQRAAGRPRKQRVKARGEPGKRGPYQCKRCFQFGHIEKGCNATQAELEQELPPPRPKKGKKQRINNYESVGASTTDSRTSKAAIEPSPMPHSSPGVTIRRMSSISPTSPGVTTRRMAAISPGGINRRLIIE